MIEFFRTYGWTGAIRLLYSLVCTWIWDRPARLIRRPFYVRGRKNMKWGGGFTTGVGVRLDVFCNDRELKLLIGERVQLNDYVHIGAIESIVIGNDVLIASRVFITDHHHGNYQDAQVHSSPNTIPSDRPLTARPVIIGDRVWIGENVTILPGVSIGAGAIIGAGAVVTKDIPANSIAVGVPAKVVKKYDFDNRRWVMT